MRRTAPVLALVAVLVTSAGLLSGCSGGDDASAPTPVAPTGGAGPPSPSLYTLTPLPVPPKPPPTGRLSATMRQSSRDVLLNRFEVWVDNDTSRTIHPTRVSYRDGRFTTALMGTRLRAIPSRTEIGFPIYQPPRPACSSRAPGGAVTVSYRAGSGTRTVTTRVDDETDVVGRYTSARCLDLAVREVATLSFADGVPQDPPGGRGAGGHLSLVARTSGRAGHTLTIDSVTGTPVLSPVGSGAWRPGITIAGDQPDQRIDLPVRPTRCDAHAFAESGGATTFLVGIHLDDRPGQLRIMMSTRGSKNAIDFALTDCGLLSTVGGG